MSTIFQIVSPVIVAPTTITNHSRALSFALSSSSISSPSFHKKNIPLPLFFDKGINIYFSLTYFNFYVKFNRFLK